MRRAGFAACDCKNAAAAAGYEANMRPTVEAMSPNVWKSCVATAERKRASAPQPPIPPPPPRAHLRPAQDVTEVHAKHVQHALHERFVLIGC